MKKVIFFGFLLITIVIVNHSCMPEDKGELTPDEVQELELDTTYVVVEGIAFSNGNVRNVSFTSAEISGQIAGLDSSRPISEHGHVWSSTNATPTLDDPNSIFTSLGERNTKGEFKSTLADLESGEQYYLRAYVIAGGATIYHNRSLSFSTFRQGLATVTIDNAQNITENSFNISATLESDGGDPVTEYGFVWASSYDNPTAGFNEDSAVWTNGTNNTNFSHNLQDLEHTSSFYLRAYAKNTFGTAYSDTKFVRTASPYVVTDGLLAYYRFDNNFDDEWGLYNGVNQNVTFTSNTVNGIGSAAQFIPSNGSHVVVPSYPLYNAGTGSISVWLKSTNTSTQCIFHGNNISGYKGFDVLTSGGRVYFNDIVDNYACSSDGWEQNFPIDLTQFVFDGQWHLFTITIEPNEQKIYVDGTKLSTVTYNQGLESTNSPAMTIGRFSETCNFNHYYNGEMDNFRIYNRVLSIPEIQEIFRKQQ